MARVTRGSVIRGAASARPTAAAGVTAPARGLPRGRVIPSEVMDARGEAAHILARAHEEAARITSAAEARGRAREEEERVALAREADAKVAAEIVALRSDEDARAARDFERLLDTAVVLAERVVGAALELQPTRIVDMAQAALREARGARRLVFEAHPLDAAVLETQLGEAGLSAESFTIETHGDLARGDLVLRTELGTLDARRKTQLQRLADSLARRRSGRDG